MIPFQWLSFLRWSCKWARLFELSRFCRLTTTNGGRIQYVLYRRYERWTWIQSSFVVNKPRYALSRIHLPASSTGTIPDDEVRTQASRTVTPIHVIWAQFAILNTAVITDSRLYKTACEASFHWLDTLMSKYAKNSRKYNQKFLLPTNKETRHSIEAVEKKRESRKQSVTSTEITNLHSVFKTFSFEMAEGTRDLKTKTRAKYT